MSSGFSALLSAPIAPRLKTLRDQLNFIFSPDQAPSDSLRRREHAHTIEQFDRTLRIAEPSGEIRRPEQPLFCGRVCHQ